MEIFAFLPFFDFLLPLPPPPFSAFVSPLAPDLPLGGDAPCEPDFTGGGGVLAGEDLVLSAALPVRLGCEPTGWSAAVPGLDSLLMTVAEAVPGPLPGTASAVPAEGGLLQLAGASPLVPVDAGLLPLLPGAAPFPPGRRSSPDAVAVMASAARSARLASLPLPLLCSLPHSSPR